MNRAKQVVALALVGLFAGLLGGVLSVWLMERGKNLPKSTDVIRAKQFEAVGTDGTVRALFGLDSGDVPVMRFFGPDGSERLLVMLDNVDEPITIMRDRKGSIRAFIGHQTSDTASAADDDWSVSFPDASVDGSFLATVGTIQSYPSHKYKGVVGARDETGRWTSIRRP